LSLDDVYGLAWRTLHASGATLPNAESVARSLRAAEADGMHSHGLMRLPAYCRHVLSGKVRGDAEPVLRQPANTVFMVDAAHGFAHPAIDLGLPELAKAARASGIAMLGIHRAYHAGAMGYHVERLAQDGVIGLAFANAPASIAPWGGATAVFGTNPVAFSAPGPDGPALVIDQACSTVARGEVVRKALAGEPLPAGWALDAQGLSTTDPQEALAGTMLPFGGAKGVNIAWIVEILAAVLTGALPSHEAGSVIENDGRPPGLGQLFIALDPDVFVPGGARRLEQLCRLVAAQQGARLPGAGRWRERMRSKEEGISISASLHQEIQSFL
jgi:(2R)-3-sulfolactate dehydrogenase (NADP+)